MLIASNSGYIAEIAAQNYEISYGNELSGWNGNEWDLSYDGKNVPSLKNTQANCTVPLPIDLFPNDLITLCGIAYTEQVGGDITNDPTLTTNLTYVSCNDVTNIENPSTNTIFISEGLEASKYGYCFSTTHVLSQQLRSCDTLLLVAIGLDSTNSDAAYRLKFSYTLSIQRNCSIVDTTPNMILKLCCDTLIQEIVYDPGLTVGDFFVDNEGNCWQANAKTGLSTTGSRVVSTTYASCVACTTANPCPENLIAEACCGLPQQVYTGSLPGVGIGDTFVDTYGFCWSVVGTTPAPITGLIYVGATYTSSDCDDETCTNANTCPDVYSLKPCCKYGGGELFTTLDLLGGGVANGDTFVDTFGFCWQVFGPVTGVLVNAPFIEVDTIYSSCESCLATNPCSQTPIYFTFQNCCTDEIEVALAPFGGGLGQTYAFDTSINPGLTDCWKVLSWSSTGTTTMTINGSNGGYRDCISCIKDYPCVVDVFEVTDCCGTLPNQIVSAPGYLVSGDVIVDTLNRCWQIVSTIAGVPSIVYSTDYPDGCEACTNTYFCET